MTDKKIAGYDEAFNLQIAKNLSQHFIYATTYLPLHVNDARITTNGPLQYLGGLSVYLFGWDWGYIVALATALCLFLYAVQAFSLVALIGVASSFFFWPQMLGLCTSYMGEITATSFCLLGFTEVLRGRQRWQQSFFHSVCLAGIFFGLAISTKLVVTALIPLLLLCSGLGGGFAKCSTRERLLALTYICAVMVAALLTFVLVYYASMLQSEIALRFERNSLPVSQHANDILGFITSHFKQQHELGNLSSPWTTSFTNYYLPILLAASALACLITVPSAVPVFIFTAAVVQFANFSERRSFIFLLICLFLGFYSTEKMLVSGKWRATILTKMSASLVLLSIFTFVYLSFPAMKTQYSRFVQRAVSKSEHLYQPVTSSATPELVQAIRSIPGPIIAGGWWQYPEGSLVAGVNFYDRLEPETQSLLRTDKQLYVIRGEDTGKVWPNTDSRFCEGTPVFEDALTILCHLNRQQKLDSTGQ